MTEIAVIGGGIGGLALTLALRALGRDAIIYEQAPQLSEVGAGIMLTPNACRVLRFLGVYDAVAKRAERPAASHVRHWQTGAELSTVTFGSAFEDRFGSPFLTIHRADLQAVLLDAVGPIELNSTVVAVAPLGDRAQATYSDGRTITADAIIGCDGIRSVVRSAVAEAAPPRFTGNVAWRGLVPIDALGPAARTTDTFIWTGPQRHVIQYTVKQGAFVNYVAIAESDSWREEGWSVRSSIAEVQAAFAGWHDEFQDLLANTPADGCFQWGLFDRDPLPRWTKGRIALLGDAAHPMLPFMAQGAAMSMEDAVILARAIAAHRSIDDAFAVYETARHDRTSWAQLRSRFFGDLYHRDATPDELNAARGGANAVLYSYDAPAVPLDEPAIERSAR